MHEYVISYKEQNRLLLIENKIHLTTSICEELNRANIKLQPEDLKLHFYHKKFDCFYEVHSAENFPDEGLVKVLTNSEAVTETK